MGRIIFRRANLIDGRNAPKKNATIVVENDRITTVASNGDAPKANPNDVVYDLSGRSLMPGMVQCHYHVAYANCEHIEDIDLRYPATMLALIAAKNAELLLRSGFTAAVGAGTLHNIDVTLKRAIDAGVIPGPRLLPCGPEIITTGDAVDIHPTWWKLRLEGGLQICDGPAEFRKAVRVLIKQGAEIIKVAPTGGHGNGPADVRAMTIEEINAAADTAHDRGKKIRGHTISKRGILAALDARFDLIDHCDQMDDECIERFVKQGAFVTPSLYFQYLMVERNRLSGKSAMAGIDELERGLEHSYEMVPKANAAGVKLGVGHDFGVP